MTTTPRLVDGRRIVFVGGTADGQELVVRDDTRRICVPVLGHDGHFVEQRYTFSGQVRADYIELWTLEGRV